MRADERKIVLSHGGTAERTVSVRDIVIPDVPEMTAEQIVERWIRSAHQLHADVTRLVGELRDGQEPTTDLFVPDYWSGSVLELLPQETKGRLLELWHLAHDLGKATMRRDIARSRVIRMGLPGNQYYTRSKDAQQSDLHLTTAHVFRSALVADLTIISGLHPQSLGR